MNKIISTAILFLTINVALGQAVKKEAEMLQTKMDRFTSKTGAFSKFVDTKLPSLKSSYGASETRIRKLIAGQESLYFYQIEKAGQYSSTTASIEYGDLLEVIKALKVLHSEIDKDLLANPGYLENKFTTVDGFQVGYFIDKDKAFWYIKLEKYGSDNTILINDFSMLETAFNDAKTKIEELKKI